MSNAFRARLCFGCEHHGASEHKHGASACNHPRARDEARHLEADASGSRASIATPRTMNVRLYPGLTVLTPDADYPFAFDPIVIDSCDAYTAKTKAVAQ